MELARRKPRSYHPHFQGGPGAASQVLVQSAYHTGRGVTQGRTLSLYSGPALMGVTRPEDARVAIRANPGDLVKMAIPPPPPPHTHGLTEQVSRATSLKQGRVCCCGWNVAMASAAEESKVTRWRNDSEYVSDCPSIHSNTIYNMGMGSNVVLLSCCLCVLAVFAFLVCSNLNVLNSNRVHSAVPAYPECAMLLYSKHSIHAFLIYFFRYPAKHVVL